jgi:hypothetical protein
MIIRILFAVTLFQHFRENGVNNAATNVEGK